MEVKRKKGFENLIVYCLLAVALILALFPIYWVVMGSFQTEVQIMQWPPTWVVLPNLANYYEIFKAQPLFDYLRNSVIVVFSSVALALILGSPAAFALATLRVPGRESFFFYFLATRMAPPIIFVIPYYLIVTKLRIFDSPFVIIAVYTCLNLPLVVWIMRGFFEDIPREINDSALIDGCSRFNAFLRIMIPLALPGLAAAGVICFILCWNEYLYTLALTRETTKTITVAISAYKGYLQVKTAQVCAASTIAMGPVIVFGMIFQKFLIRGLTFGAIKG